MTWEYVIAIFGFIGTLFGIYSVLMTRKDKAIKDAKDNDAENSNQRIDIAVFSTEIKYIKEDMKEMRDDMKEIKQMFGDYKDDVRDIASEVARSVAKEILQEHIKEYHSKEK